MSKTKKSKRMSFLSVLLVLLFITLGVATVLFVNLRLTQKTEIAGNAYDPNYVLEATITDPPANTILQARTRSSVTVTIGEHTYPIKRVLFNFSGKNLCDMTAAPYVCNYRVPYTGSGAHLPNGSKSAIGLTVYVWDTAGHISVETLQLWSTK